MARKKTIRCVLPGCDFSGEAETEEELVKKLAEHACEDHGVEEIPDDVLKQAKATVKEA